MVGFDPAAKKKLSKAEHGAAGATSGAVTRFLCQPLDVIKIRFQLQVEPISRKSKDSKYRGVAQAARCILVEEGVPGLWKGHVPAQLLSIIYGIAQFMSFEVLTQHTWLLVPQLRGDHYQPVVHFVCGGVAGSLATLASFPTDVIRTRFVAQGEPKIYRNMLHAVTMIYKTEGSQAFFKGLSPTLLQIAPHAAAQFACYNIFTTIWKRIVEHSGEHIQFVPVSGSLVCGSLAGVCAKTIVYPLDVAKKRIQIQGFEHARKSFGKVFTCRGLFNCLWLTAREEKMMGLFKGLWPSLLKAGVTTALHFSVYEQACQAIAATHSS